jgi:chromosome partitioning protein
MTAKQMQKGQENWPNDPVAGNTVPVNILKGGAGKSAISLNLAERLAARGHQTLYIDLDPNGHTTFNLGFDDIYESDRQDLSEVLFGERSKSPYDVIYQTDFGFDFVPASEALEDVETDMREIEGGGQALRDHFLAPVMEQRYDYCVIDHGGERSHLSDSSLYAAKQILIPLEPGAEAWSGFKRTWTRIIGPFMEKSKFKILAIVPNKIRNTIEHQTEERVLIETLNTHDKFEFKDKLPKFARITEEEFEKINSGEMVKTPKPGIRYDTKFTQAAREGVPLAEYSGDSRTVQDLTELAKVVEHGGTQHE